jgi:hypothetical protein
VDGHTSAAPCRGAEGTWIDATTTHPDIRSESTRGACARENNPGLTGWLRFAVGGALLARYLCGTRTRTHGRRRARGDGAVCAIARCTVRAPR